METTRYKAISSRVLVVARANPNVGDWAAYVDAVPGMNHSEEWEEVLKHGEKLSEEVAKIYFPDYAEEYTWRD